ncbi:MAG: hypothetical protein V1685_01385 [Parcubacteria group bacterium]
MDPIGQKIENKETGPDPDNELARGAETPTPGVRIEKGHFPEVKPEPEKQRESAQREAHEQPLTPIQPASQTQTGPAAVQVSAAQVKAVETILEENLQAVFKTMDANQQNEFKQQGEVTARKLVILMSAVKFRVKEITRAIVRWLRFIPGVSNFFVEQEAKIKTDKLVELHWRQTNQK